MDLAIILDGWPYDEQNESSNVRKIVGVDGRLKLQVRLRSGVVQWEVEGRPDGGQAWGFASVLDHTRHLADVQSGEKGGFKLDQALTDALLEEMRDYARRRHAFMLIGDYRHALSDALHGLCVLDVVRDHAADRGGAARHERQRPQLLVDRARAEALLEIQREQLASAVAALTQGIEDIESYYRSSGTLDEIARCEDRRMLIDFRRSLRERYQVPLSDVELLQTLKAEQQVAVEQEDYEMAARLRDKINILQARIDKT